MGYAIQNVSLNKITNTVFCEESTRKYHSVSLDSSNVDDVIVYSYFMPVW